MWPACSVGYGFLSLTCDFRTHAATKLCSLAELIRHLGEMYSHYTFVNELKHVITKMHREQDRIIGSNEEATPDAAMKLGNAVDELRQMLNELDLRFSGNTARSPQEKCDAWCRQARTAAQTAAAITGGPLDQWCDDFARLLSDLLRQAGQFRSHSGELITRQMFMQSAYHNDFTSTVSDSSKAATIFSFGLLDHIKKLLQVETSELKTLIPAITSPMAAQAIHECLQRSTWHTRKSTSAE